MPAIIIKDYTWRQTSEFVIIYVPLRGSPKKLDFFVIDDYVKASFPPFLLELFLWSSIVEEKSECTVTNSEVIFSLQKMEIGLEWPFVEVQDIDREIKRERRNRALERAHTVAEDREKARSEQRQYLQREAVKAQIKIDTATLNKIEAMRDAHRKEAMQEFENWRTNAELPILQDVEGKIQKNQKAYKPPLKWFKDDKGEIKSRPLTEKEILNDVTCTTEERSSKLKMHERKESGITQSSNNINNVESERTANNVNGTILKIQSKQGNSADKADKTEAKEEITKPTKEVFDTTDESSYDECTDSESEAEICKTKCLLKETEEGTLQKLYKKKQKEHSRVGLIENLLKHKCKIRNSIFDQPEKSVPLPRKSSTINITFSERVFPTPARESSHLQEQEWLEKQVEARRKTGFAAEDLRPEERDPQWLKDKGDDFFKVGNYLGAISAYTHGIKISDKMASLYVNRSAAHYALGNYYRCTQDCSKALELMEPKCEGNRESRARCHARRGAALCKLSAPQHGIPELEAALKLAPDNESIKRDLLAVKRYFDIKH